MNQRPTASLTTKETLRDAFWRLYLQKPVAQITVKEIAALAGYNRSTFYQYYADTYAVLEEIEDLVLNTVEQAASFISERAQEMPLSEILNALIYGGHGNPHYLISLLAGPDSAHFECRLIDRLKGLFSRLFIWEGVDDNRKQFFMEYHINGILGVVKYSIRQGREPSTEEMITTLSVISGRPVSALVSEPFSALLRMNLSDGQ
ncbi:MAG: TetR/AcrR family transcriptional regulator [Candidatus Onthomonas sp.]